jgi:hypothetical protein
MSFVTYLQTIITFVGDLGQQQLADNFQVALLAAGNDVEKPVRWMPSHTPFCILECAIDHMDAEKFTEALRNAIGSIKCKVFAVQTLKRTEAQYAYESMGLLDADHPPRLQGYTTDQIRDAFFETFQNAGEVFFGYGDAGDADRVQMRFDDFMEELNK